MLDRTEQTVELIGWQQRIGNYLWPIAFFSAAGVVMIIWIAAIGWIGFRWIAWMFF